MSKVAIDTSSVQAAIAAIVAGILWLAAIIIDVGLAILFASTVVKLLGGKIPYVPSVTEAQLAWLMLAYAGYKFKGKLV